jgi:hypothetical protein
MNSLWSRPNAKGAAHGNQLPEVIRRVIGGQQDRAEIRLAALTGRNRCG